MMRGQQAERRSAWAAGCCFFAAAPPSPIWLPSGSRKVALRMPLAYPGPFPWWSCDGSGTAARATARCRSQVQRRLAGDAARAIDRAIATWTPRPLVTRDARRFHCCSSAVRRGSSRERPGLDQTWIDRRPVLIRSRWCERGRTLRLVSVLDQWPDEVLGHPRYLAAQPVLAGLIQQLRDCANVRDGYEFQRALHSHLDAADNARAAFAWAVKRMRAGKPPQRGAPELQSGLDPSGPA